MKKNIKIDGMGCQHCVQSVRETLSKLPNVKIIDVIIGEAIVEIPENYNLSIIAEALDDAGYQVIV